MVLSTTSFKSSTSHLIPSHFEYILDYQYLAVCPMFRPQSRFPFMLIYRRANDNIHTQHSAYWFRVQTHSQIYYLVVFLYHVCCTEVRCTPIKCYCCHGENRQESGWVSYFSDLQSRCATVSVNAPAAGKIYCVFTTRPSCGNVCLHFYGVILCTAEYRLEV